MYDIKKVAVLGSGVMGAAIAAHLANAGLKVTLLDIVPDKLTEEEKEKNYTLQDKAVKNRIVLKAQERMKNKKSLLLYVPENIDLITFGNFTDDLELLKEADWVVEAVVENIDIKKSLYQKVVPYLKAKVLLSSNTSGISVNAMSEVLPKELRESFFVTHFFNPPRFMKLLELVPCQDTSLEVIEYMQEFCEEKLGKGIVVAKDTPGFIANRVGVFALTAVINKMEKYGLSFEEVDALTGSEIGRPRTGTFRLIDMIGIDTTVNVANYLRDNTSNTTEKEMLRIPQYLHIMLQNGILGDKSKHGFYKKEGKETFVIVPETLEYRGKKGIEFESLTKVKESKVLQDKVKALISGEDRAGQFVWDVLRDTLLFCAGLISEVADDTKAIDDSMKWGYNWVVGPFELWDMIGVRQSVERMEKEKVNIPDFVKDMLAMGKENFYADPELSLNKKKINPVQLKKQGQIIMKNEHASLIDMGDNVACFVLHSPNSSITDEVVQFTHKALAEVEKDFKGMVIASTGKHFCVGANLPYILQNAQDKKWQAIEDLVTDFQGMNMALKYCSKPIVAAPYSMTLGGGAEIVLHSTKVRAFAETYLGLVEVGVGLLPAGAGTKEMLLRATEHINDDSKIDMAPYVMKAFDIITKAKVSANEQDAKKIGYLRNSDSIAMNKDLQTYLAKKDVLQQSENMVQPQENKKYRVGGESLYALLAYNLYQMKRGEFISEYDEYIGQKIAYVLCGGKIASNALVSEQYLLDLEKETFISLCGELKTQARIEHMLKKGKALRN